jgi:chorismate--pyruvate lyase
MWSKNIANLKQRPSAKLMEWLLTPNNLGEAMRQVCQTLSLTIIEQVFGLPFNHEEQLLEIDSQADKTCFLRRIVLLGDGLPFSFASVVIPIAVYYLYTNDFDSLGTKLIGETLLYNDPSTTRSEFEFCLVDDTNPLFKLIPNPHQQSEFWARRSLFKLKGLHPLLITECFFETIPVRVKK